MHVAHLRRQSTWRGVVGLEIHAQVSSKSKLFSGASTAYGAPANSQVSFFDAALPGTLPVLNRRCVEAAVATALVLRCRLNPSSRFDRKHYFYADMPAGYQITQYHSPVASGGHLEYVDYVFGRDSVAKVKAARITQVQIEQDSGKSMYDTAAGQSLVDLNRAGIGLMEIVTEPDFCSGDEAAAFVRELHAVLKCIGSCDGRMEEGALRVDANISVHRPDEPLGTRVEVKNLNSFKHVAAAIDYEIDRQCRVLASGHAIVNETRSYDSEKRATIAMRDKEKLQDYRIMPEPNLPPLRLRIPQSSSAHGSEVVAQRSTSGELDVGPIDAALPELPASTRRRLVSDYRLTLERAVLLMSYDGFLQLFHDVCRRVPTAEPARICSFLVRQVLTVLNESGLSATGSPTLAVQVASVCEGIEQNFITEATAKKILDVWHTGTVEDRLASMHDIVLQKGWQKITDASQVRSLVAGVIANNRKPALQYKQKKHRALFTKLMTKLMEQSEHRIDYVTAAALLEEEVAKLS